MNFWDNVETAATMEGVFLWVVLGYIVATFILFGFVPAARARIRGAMLLFALSFVGLLVAGTILSFNPDQKGAAYQWTRWPSLFIKAIAIINLASVVIFDVALERLRLKPAKIMRDLLLALAYVVTAIVLLSSGGVDLTGIVATSAVVTAVIGFSLQDTLGNIMGGMALQMERSIRVGDWIRVDRQEGQVKEISWRVTSIETRDWDTVVIPNSVLMKGQVTVLGRRVGSPYQHRQTLLFNVDFRYAPTDIIDAVETALRAEPIPNVAREPAPTCLLIDFKDSFASYSVRFWIQEIGPNDPTDSVVRTRVYSALRRAGIPLSIPAQAFFITADNEKRRERKRSEEIQRRVEALQHVELFNTLTVDERRELAARLRTAPYVRGEAIMRQGGHAQSLYIMRKGEVEVRVAVDGSGLSEKVATLHGNDFFGEMGLMTGEPRAATVVAGTDVECYRLDKDAFNDILRRRPEIASDISHILARRRVELEAVREDLNEEAVRQRMRHTEGDLLDRIRKFFTLDGSNGHGG